MIVYRENDLTPDTVNQLRTAVGWTAYSRPQLERALQSTIRSITAWDGPRPVGMARLTGDGIYDFLYDVIVAPDVQRQGIGRRMVQTLIQHTRRSLAPGERCSITLVSAEGKEDFYASLGFTSLPNSRAGHGMQLFLAP